MITNLEDRARFWGTRDEGAFGEGCSVGDPFRKHVDIFQDKRVLEIGPGAGRQFSAISPLAKNYAVADISKKVLAKKIYANTPQHVLTSYADSLVFRFDVVHFWYVLHHVRQDELTRFAAFVARHTRPGGYAYFNTLDPRDDLFAKDDLLGDGIVTTPHRLAEVEAAFRWFNMLDVETLAGNCISVLCQKERK